MQVHHAGWPHLFMRQKSGDRAKTTARLRLNSLQGDEQRWARGDDCSGRKISEENKRRKPEKTLSWDKETLSTSYSLFKLCLYTIFCLLQQTKKIIQWELKRGTFIFSLFVPEVGYFSVSVYHHHLCPWKINVRFNFSQILRHPVPIITKLPRDQIMKCIRI